MRKFIDLEALGADAPAIINLRFVQYIVTAGKSVHIGFIDGSQNDYHTKGNVTKFAEKIISKWLAEDPRKILIITEFELGIGAIRKNRVASIKLLAKTLSPGPIIQIWFLSGNLHLRDLNKSLNREQMQEKTKLLIDLFMENI